MSDTADRYRRLSEAFAETIRAVPDDRWSSPSPCEGWDARDVVRHVVETQGLFLGFVGRDLGEAPSVDDDPAAAWDHARAIVQADLDDPDRANATFQGVLGTTSFAEGVDRFLCADLVVHRWDLARAAGLEVRLDPDDMAHIRAGLEPLVEHLRSPQAFGPELEPPAGADEQTRFLAFLGRRAW